LVQLGVNARSFLHGALDRLDVRHLGADVKMQELEAMAEVLRLEESGGGEKFDGAEPELRVCAAAFGPASGALAEQAGANADQRFDIQLFRNLDDLAKFLELLDDHD